jgi:hypothetical protein
VLIVTCKGNVLYSVSFGYVFSIRLLRNADVDLKNIAGSVNAVVDVDID